MENELYSCIFSPFPFPQTLNGCHLFLELPRNMGTTNREISVFFQWMGSEL